MWHGEPGRAPPLHGASWWAPGLVSLLGDAVSAPSLAVRLLPGSTLLPEPCFRRLSLTSFHKVRFPFLGFLKMFIVLLL